MTIQFADGGFEQSNYDPAQTSWGYEYRVGFHVIGLNVEPGRTHILHEASPRAVLSSDSDRVCEELDQATAWGAVILRRIFVQSEESPEVLFQKELASIRLQRARTLTGSMLILEFSGAATPNWAASWRIYAGRLFGFDLIAKGDISEQHRPAVDAFQNALTAMTDPPTELKRVASAAVLRSADGRIAHSFSFSGSARVVTSKRLDNLGASAIAGFAKGALRYPRTTALELAAAAADETLDDFRRFTASWNALEALVNGTFKVYNELVNQRLLDGAPAILREHLQRINEVMKGRYRVQERFRVMAMALVAPDEAAEDLREFKTLKKARDTAMHRTPGDITADVALRARRLVAKYLKLDIERTENCVRR